MYYWLPDFYCRSLNPVEARERKESGSRSQGTKNARMTINFAIFPCPNLLGLLVWLETNPKLLAKRNFLLQLVAGPTTKWLNYMTTSATPPSQNYGYFSEKKKLGGMWFLNVRCFYCLGIASVLTWWVVTQLNRINVYSVARTVCYVSFSLRMRSNRIRLF